MKSVPLRRRLPLLASARVSPLSWRPPRTGRTRRKRLKEAVPRTARASISALPSRTVCVEELPVKNYVKLGRGLKEEIREREVEIKLAMIFDKLKEKGKILGGIFGEAGGDDDHLKSTKTKISVFEQQKSVYFDHRRSKKICAHPKDFQAQPESSEESQKIESSATGRRISKNLLNFSKKGKNSTNPPSSSECKTRELQGGARVVHGLVDPAAASALVQGLTSRLSGKFNLGRDRGGGKKLEGHMKKEERSFIPVFPVLSRGFKRL